MYRLDGQDAIFLYRETPAALMHTLKVHIVKPGNPDESCDAQFRRLKRHLLNSAPVLRQRVLDIPFGIHHPVLVDDPNFDVSAHVYRAAIPAPGGMRELDNMVAQIGSTPLDRSRPLWEMWLLEGLDSGHMVMVHKVHHAMADGKAYAELLNGSWNIPHTLYESEADLPVPAPLPSGLRLFCGAWVDHFKNDIWNLWPLLKSFLGNLNELRKQRRDSTEERINPLTEEFPRLAFNRALGVKRSFRSCQLSLDEVKELKNALGVTLNDVVLAVMAGALRSYLQYRDELPDKPLALSVPVGADEPGSTRVIGNRVTTLFSMLHTEIADPIERLYAIREKTEQGKADLAIFGKHQWGDLMEYVPPGLMSWLAGRAFRKKPADQPGYRPNTNVVISNVPGPASKLGNDSYGELSGLYSAGVLGEGMGLNITVWSYVDKLNVGVLACGKAMPDLERFADAIPQALQELQAATFQDTLLQGTRTQVACYG
jgi:WS/DGAT/MGAT family acyltransferase